MATRTQRSRGTRAVTPSRRAPARANPRIGSEVAAATADARCSGIAEETLLQHAVSATYWFDPGESGHPRSTSIRFTGRRVGAPATPSPGDRFEKVETVKVVPGSGPVSVTTRASGVTPGEWKVRAEPVERHPKRAGKRQPDPRATAGTGLARLLWSKGNPVTAKGSTTLRTRITAFTTAPGIVPGSWPGLVGAGALAAFAMLAALLSRVDVPAGTALGIAIAACIGGAIGARVWYVVLQRGQAGGTVTRGLCIQGFILGVILVAVPGLLAAGISLTTFLDAATPGLFLAMTVGRQGCFFTGCCSGRLTASRWGVWSSDGRIGAKRIPTQQLESLVCLVIAATTLLVFLRVGTEGNGVIFVAAVAAYTFARQVLFKLRAEPRRTKRARTITMAVAVVAIAIATLASFIW